MTGKIFVNRPLARAPKMLISFVGRKKEMTQRELCQRLSFAISILFSLNITPTKTNSLKYYFYATLYSRGLELIGLEGMAFSSFSYRETAFNHLTQLQTKTKESILLGVLRPDRLAHLDEGERPQKPIHFRTDAVI